MSASRLEAFSDGVIAILITVMVLELRVPNGATWTALGHDAPVLLAYLLSFVYLGIYWNNHHHMFRLVSRVSGGVLWANLHLLFWLSLVPFVTSWLSEERFATVPTAAYGILLLLAAVAFSILEAGLVHVQGRSSRLAAAMGRDVKGKASLVLYVAGIALTFLDPRLGLALYVVVAIVWVLPDRRVERELARGRGEEVGASESNPL
ncbi:MAG TPA: TMEM175 family protein [Amnibacterium sp.]|nr:TMEM175 family protein [Amnibacterium sp.]